jgi:hypothetical protein
MLVPGKIVHAGGNDGQGAWNQLFRMTSLAAMTLHIMHLTVEFAHEPGIETGLGLGEVDITDADLLKPEFTAPEPDIAHKRCDLIFSESRQWIDP